MQFKAQFPLDLARANAERTGRLLKWAVLPPLPLFALGVLLLQIFAGGHAAGPDGQAVQPWYRDAFLLSLFAVYAFGQLVALLQLRDMRLGLGKVKAVLGAMPGSGALPSAMDLSARLQSVNAPGHLLDLVQSWLRLGQAGDAEAVNSLMERAGRKRGKAVERKIGLHATLNRIMLKLGFLGTLIGLIVTFPPMKSAILTLDPKNVEKGASFVQHIAGAIDGDQYAILTTLIATGFSLFIELLTVQILRAVCGRFESVNAGVDEWCVSELQPAIRRGKDHDAEGTLARQRAFHEQVLQAERQFQEQWLRAQGETTAAFLESQQEARQQVHEIQAGLARSVESLGRLVRGVSEGMQQTIPIQQGYGRRLDELLAYERQYRSFLEARDGITVPSRLKPELN